MSFANEDCRHAELRPWRTWSWSARNINGIVRCRGQFESSKVPIAGSPWPWTSNHDSGDIRSAYSVSLRPIDLVSSLSVHMLHHVVQEEKARPATRFRSLSEPKGTCNDDPHDVPASPKTAPRYQHQSSTQLVSHHPHTIPHTPAPPTLNQNGPLRRIHQGRRRQQKAETNPNQRRAPRGKSPTTTK